MLVLGRREKESVVLTTPDNTAIIVSVERIDGKQIRLGIEAPNQIDIQRGEILYDIKKERKQ